VLIDCPPSLGLLTVNGLFAADRALIVTEPGAWASDGVAQILRTVERIGARRPGGLEVAGIAVNRLGRTRDARYWYDQLVESYGEDVLPPVHLRAAVPESAAQARPIHGLGARPGAAEAAAEFDQLLAHVFAEADAGPDIDLVVDDPQDAGAAPLHVVPDPAATPAGGRGIDDEPPVAPTPIRAEQPAPVAAGHGGSVDDPGAEAVDVTAPSGSPAF
jgi:hypothetical protein